MLRSTSDAACCPLELHDGRCRPAALQLGAAEAVANLSEPPRFPPEPGASGVAVTCSQNVVHWRRGETGARRAAKPAPAPVTPVARLQCNATIAWRARGVTRTGKRICVVWRCGCTCRVIGGSVRPIRTVVMAAPTPLAAAAAAAAAAAPTGGGVTAAATTRGRGAAAPTASAGGRAPAAGRGGKHAPRRGGGGGGGAPAGGRVERCSVCGDAPKKYRCPTCTAPYCSAACFAAHKPSCAPPAGAHPPAAADDAPSSPARYPLSAAALAPPPSAPSMSRRGGLYASDGGSGGGGGGGGGGSSGGGGADADDIEAALLSDAALARLADDAGLVAKLRDPRLQRALAAIDAAPNRVAALDDVRRREGPQFQSVLDDMLVAVGVAERDAAGVVMFVGLPPARHEHHAS